MTRSILTILTLLCLLAIPVEQLGHRQVQFTRGNGVFVETITICGDQQYVRGVHRDLPEQYRAMELPKPESGE